MTSDSATDIADAELASHLAVDHTNRVFHNLQRLTDA